MVEERIAPYQSYRGGNSPQPAGSNSIIGAIGSLLRRNPALLLTIGLAGCPTSLPADRTQMDAGVVSRFDGAFHVGDMEVGQNLALLSEQMIEAACNGDVHTVQSLLNQGVNIDVQDPRGFTALICASCNGQLEVIKLLIEKRANLNIQDVDGMTALHHAALFQEYEAFTLLLNARPNLELKEKDGFTVLLFMSIFGGDYCPYAEALLAAGANVDNPDFSNYSPLMGAAQNDHLNKVSLLLRYNPNINARDNFGMTALGYAVANQSDQVAVLLRQHGAIE